MCGLFSSIGFAPDRSRIDIVAHRGPDGSGWEVHDSPLGPVALGHRRLAIIDLSEGGHQPTSDPSGRFHIVFNGEIYNYIELRETLRQQGETFTTTSDTEVLLRAFTVWGDRALDKLRGMFAFVIWDKRDKRLFAARDRFGIKPLYVFQTSAGIAFASEIKQLLSLPGVNGRMNIARVHDFLSNGISDHTAETMFDGIRQIRAGEWLTVETSKGQLSATVRRWYPAVAQDLEMTETEAAVRFRAALTEAVTLHLRSDVPVGSCLSGGLDSSSIVCLMSDLMRSREGGARVNTISACYAEASVDEKKFMDIVVEQAGTIPHFIFPRADDVFAKASEITWHQDEPFGSTSIFAQWCVFDEARRAGIKVMLDGQGADEPLAGYHGGFAYYTADLARRGDVRMLLRTITERKAYHGSPVKDQLQALLTPLLPAKLKQRFRKQRPKLASHAWMDSDVLRQHGNPKGALTIASEQLGLPPVIDIKSLCLTLTHASNLQMLLHWEDRNSMAHSIEARVPFLDHPLVEFALGLGNSHKIVGGDTKRVLRAGMMDVLPEAVRQRRDKLGFATPEQEWFRGPLRGLVEQGIENTLRRFPDLMNPTGVRRLSADMLDGRRPIDFTLWRIVNLGIWGDRFGVSM